MKTGIFETEHFEGSYPVIKLFDNGKNDITIFTYQSAWEQFKHLFPGEPEKYEWIVKPETRSKYLFIRDMYREIKRKKIELVYLNTISNNFIIYALFVLLLRKTRVILTIHNINSQFEFKPSLSPRRIIRYIGRRMLLSVIKEFNVVGMTLVGPLEERLAKNDKVYCVPGAVFEETNCRQTQPSINDRINIVIPGTVDGRRRDYEQAIALVRLLEQQRVPVTITFLGRFYEQYGAGILQKIKDLRLVHTRLDYYEFETVAQPEFDRIMNNAHFVFIPSVLTTVIEDGVRELYGTTISSGNLFDVIKHAKPFIIPERLKIDAFLERSCFRYSRIEEITGFIIRMRDDMPGYTALLEDALQASRNYTIQKIRERNPGLFNS
jgi:hypothetical protein